MEILAQYRMAGQSGIAFPERTKKPGICYAVTDDGVELPVIDITHPAFRFQLRQAEWRTLTARAAAVARSRFKTSVVRWVLVRHSVIIRAGVKAQGTFVAGMDTYLWKLGPDNPGKAL